MKTIRAVTLPFCALSAGAFAQGNGCNNVLSSNLYLHRHRTGYWLRRQRPDRSPGWQ